MAEDPKTRSLVLCVMDGHGEDGDKVRECVSAFSRPLVEGLKKAKRARWPQP